MSQSRSEPAVGIDLGTTFSAIAHIDSAGRPCTIPNAEGDLLTPSVVLFDGQATIVGKEAVKAAPVCPGDVAQSAKRDMGSSFYQKAVHGEYLPPEVIQSFILEKLHRDAALKLGDFRKVVISVPAFFNEPRRKATQDAGSLAGLEVLDIINEPTAAAIAYGVQEGFLTGTGKARKKETLLVYDLGGGTFDVTLMEIDSNNYTALATAGDVQLGGIDWDRRLADYVAEAFAQANGGLDPRESSSGMQRLLREAEDAKRTLSTRDEAAITFEHAGKFVRTSVSRQQFEEMTSDLLDRTRFTTTNLIENQGLQWSDLTRVLVVGGSSRMPAVLKMLEKVSGKTPDRCLSADEAVAHGAAIYAGFLLESQAGERPKIKVRNVNSHDLGVLGIEKATGRPRTRVMIHRNTGLPANKTARFVTHRDNQQSVAVRVVEGGDASGNDATHIGRCIIRDLPPSLPAGSPVDVEFCYEENGRLTVKARLPESDKGAITKIERESGLTADTLADWNKRLSFSDGVAKLLPGESGTELERPADSSSAALDGDESLPEPQETTEPPPFQSDDTSRADEPPSLPPANEAGPPPLPKQESQANESSLSPLVDVDEPPPLPPDVPGGVVSPSLPLPGDARLTGTTVESLRQYLQSFKVLRFSFPTSLFKPEMAFTNEAGQPTLWIAKDDGMFVRDMTFWRDHTKTVPLLRVVGAKGNIHRFNVVTCSGETIGSLSYRFLHGWDIHLPDGRVVSPSNRVSAPKTLIKIAVFVLSAGAALFVLLLLNPKPLWSLLSVGNSFSLMMDGKEVCAVKKQRSPFDVYYQVEDLSAVASKVDVALLIAAFGMESTVALMTM